MAKFGENGSNKKKKLARMEKKAVTIQFRATCLYWLGWVVLHDQKANTELSPATSRHTPNKKTQQQQQRQHRRHGPQRKPELKY